MESVSTCFVTLCYLSADFGQITGAWQDAEKSRKTLAHARGSESGIGGSRPFSAAS
jgi:hypothetical protein